MTAARADRSAIVIGRLWMIGCGAMAGAMLARWLERGLIDRAAVDVVNCADRDLPGAVRQARTLPAGPLPDMVLLGMKPQQLDTIAATHATRLAGMPLLLSILAGVEEAALRARFEAGAIVRAMPNLPVAIGQGVVALHSDSATPATWDGVTALMQPLGLVERIDNAALFDAVTALAGSGPAFLYRFLDALAAGGSALGLPEEQAERLAKATVKGAAITAAQADLPPAMLADRVASPGGSTRKGLDILDADAALENLVAATLAAATRRNREMAAAARTAPD